MAMKLNTSIDTVRYAINKKLDAKALKKPKVHKLSPKTIEKRWKRSWPLYRRLRGGRWKNVITTDEALFHLSNKDRKTRVQYLSRGESRSKLEVFETESHPKGVMVWIGISANGCTKARFVKTGVKINTQYYINNVLKPFIKEDVPKLYPNGDFLFQQDSAPSHRSKATQRYLREQKISFLTPEQWLANSPDCASLDYFFWGYLKR